MPYALIAAWTVALFGMTTGPFLAADGTTRGAIDAALIAGVFSTINLALTYVLNRWVIKEARKNRQETRKNRQEIRGAREASREAANELKDVKAKVKGERRSRIPRPREGGKRRGLDPGADDSQ